MRGPRARRRRALGPWAAVALVLLCPLCAIEAGAADPSEPAAAEPPAEVAEADPTAPVDRVGNPDPWERFNRFTFQLNEWGDIYGVTPLARGWRFITPGFFRKSVTSFNTNLQMPVILGNNLLQLKPRNVGDDLARLVFNLTFGIGGLIDMATLLDIPQNDEDFGQTLGYWGMPAGPYLVLPVFGPSTVRDGIGRGGDAAGTLYFSLLPFYATLVVRGVEVVNLRAAYLGEIEANRDESFDYYVFLRNAYLQNRRAKVGSRRDRSARAEEAPEDDLYYFEDELDGEDYDDIDGDAPGDDAPDGVPETDEPEGAGARGSTLRWRPTPSPGTPPGGDDAALRVDALPWAA